MDEKEVNKQMEAHSKAKQAMIMNKAEMDKIYRENSPMVYDPKTGTIKKRGK